MKPLMVQVTIEDVMGGRRGSVSACPVALALGAATGRQWFVSAHGAFLPGVFFARLPPELLTMIDHYDKTGQMHPTAFVISGSFGRRRIDMTNTRMENNDGTI